MEQRLRQDGTNQRPVGSRARRALGAAAAALLLVLVAAACSAAPSGSPDPTTTSSTTTTTIAPVDPSVGGTYAVTYGTAGSVAVHAAGTTYTVSVVKPFKVEGAACTLPTDTVIATFSGAGPRFGGSHANFDPTSCAYVSSYSEYADLSSDGSITLGSGTGNHRLTKTANAVTVASPKAIGTYRTTYGTVGSVSVHASGTDYSVSVTSPFKVQNTSCNLPNDTVIATFSGTAPRFGGSHANFDPTTCTYVSSYSEYAYLNSDGTITLDSGTGLHLLTRTGDTATIATPKAIGTYRTTYGTVGSVSVHASGTDYSVSVTSPFKVQNTSCNLPNDTVIATFSGTAPRFGGSHANFDPTTCTYVSSYSEYAYLNSDGTITLGSGTGFHLLTRTGDTSTVATPTAGGTYRTTYGTAGTVTVSRSANNYTVSVATPFRIQGAACSLPAGTVIATFSGTGPVFGGSHANFDPTTCTYVSSYSEYAYLNTDQSITLGSGTGFHLLSPI